jgi:truncated hemoglobin YjbI
MAGLYEALGGLDGCRRLSAEFYARVARDPILRPIFPSSFHCAVEALATFLAQFLGGPCVYSPQRWWLSLREAHLRFPIGQRERDAWVRDMEQVLDETEIDGDVRDALREFFEQAATDLMNRPAPSEPACPHGGLAAQWDRHLALEEAVAAVRAGDRSRVRALMESARLREYFERDPSAWVHLVGMMINHSGLVEYAVERLTRDPELARARHVRGRTLLHDAGGAGNVRMVELLLGLGADPNPDVLYHVGNECSAAGGGDVVRILVKAGADVDAQVGVKRCTALHMAARRGSVAIAEALLDCGAGLEVRDSAGETALRRAVNCGKTGVARLLVERGADRLSVGSKGLTAVGAARTAAMKAILGNQ